MREAWTAGLPVPESFWEQLADAAERFLVLDYDGTLAPFTVDRDNATPYPGVREQLEAIAAAGHTRLVVISGRSVDMVQHLLGLDPAPEIWGSHGHERLLSDGSRRNATLATSQQEALQEAEQLAAEVVNIEAVETKLACVAVHWRGKGAAEARRLEEHLRRIWEPLTASGLAIHGFDGGLELRSTAADKGSAMNELLRSAGNSPVIAYLGDDLTDEDAFAALAGRGLTVLVRPEHRATAAEVWIRPPQQLLQFLAAWHAAATGN